MKYGRIFNTQLKEGLMDGVLMNVAITGALAGKHAMIPAATQTIGENVLSGGTNKAKKLGRKFGMALYRARAGAVREASDEEHRAAWDAGTRIEGTEDSTVKPSKTPKVRYGRNADINKMADAPFGLGVGVAKGMHQQKVGEDQQARIKSLSKRLQQKSRDGVKVNQGESPEDFAKRSAERSATLQKRQGIVDKAGVGSTKDIGKAAITKRAMQKQTLRGAAGRLAADDAAKLTKIPKPTWGGKYGSFGKGAAVLGAVGAMKAVGAVKNAAEEVTKAASGGYADVIRGGSRMNMVQSSAAYGNLKENQKTWATRKAKYGPSGLKHKTWKFDFNKPSHVKKMLALKNDSDIKKLMKSNANITKHVGVTTKGGVPLKFAYKSNDGKHLYAGKTIGMRQNVISQHKKLGLQVPKGFEDFSFEQINALFKKNQKHGWYKRNYNKAPIHRKIMIGAAKLWKGVKKSFGMGESAIMEDMTLTESSAAPTVVECVFMDGRVASPTECDCQDCLVVTRRMRESAKPLNETAESSFGQMINASATPATAMAAGTPKKISKKLMFQANKRWRKLPAVGV